jgi:hypothetical protein
MTPSAPIEALLLHPSTKDLYPCRVRVARDGLVLCRVEADWGGVRGARAESDPIGVSWRSLRGFSADESCATRAGHRLQVLEIDCEEGVVTVLAPVSEVSRLFAAVGEVWQQWRIARSPLGLVLGGLRRRLVGQVA